MVHYSIKKFKNMAITLNIINVMPYPTNVRVNCIEIVPSGV
jgi:hypothetical protein